MLFDPPLEIDERWSDRGAERQNNFKTMQIAFRSPRHPLRLAWLQVIAFITEGLE